jgi:hypothetical protein
VLLRCPCSSEILRNPQKILRYSFTSPQVCCRPHAVSSACVFAAGGESTAARQGLTGPEVQPARAKRIGHGVDISYEDEALALLADMRARGVCRGVLRPPPPARSVSTPTSAPVCNGVWSASLPPSNSCRGGSKWPGSASACNRERVCRIYRQTALACQTRLHAGRLFTPLRAAAGDALRPHPQLPGP